MPIISLSSTKGGVGKSTIALNMAVQLASMGEGVSLIDSDPQGSVMRWASVREQRSEGARPVFVASAMGRALEEMARERSERGMVIIDSAGVVNERSRAVIGLADYALTLSNNAPLELWEVKTMLDVVGLVERREKRRIPSLLLLNRVHPSTRDFSDVAEYLEGSMALPSHIFDTIIRERASYKQSILEGKGVAESGDRKAREEMQSVAQELLNIVNP